MSNANATARRVRLVWQGKWSELMQQNQAAVIAPGQEQGRTAEVQMKADVKTVVDAFEEGDQK